MKAKKKANKKADAAEALRVIKETEDKIKAAVAAELEDHEKRLAALEVKADIPVPEPKKFGWLWG